MLMMYRSAQEKAPVAEEENTAEEWTWETVWIANPASTYCVEQGWEVVIKEDADWAQYGVCKLKDWTEVEELEYFRANNTEASTWAVAETGSVAETTTWSVAEAATGDAQ
jgi:putative hemolysin